MTAQAPAEPGKGDGPSWNSSSSPLTTAVCSACPVGNELGFVWLSISRGLDGEREEKIFQDLLLKCESLFIPLPSVHFTRGGGCLSGLSSAVLFAVPVVATWELPRAPEGRIPAHACS